MHAPGKGEMTCSILSRELTVVRVFVWSYFIRIPIVLNAEIIAPCSNFFFSVFSQKFVLCDLFTYSYNFSVNKPFFMFFSLTNTMFQLFALQLFL